jgi:hypothetical protein
MNKYLVCESTAHWMQQRLVGVSHARTTPTGACLGQMTSTSPPGISKQYDPLSTVIPPLDPIRRETAAQIQYPVAVAALSSEEVVIDTVTLLTIRQ